MSCNCNPDPCISTPCGCQALISSDCVNKVTAVFSCSEIDTGLTLTETLEQLDAYICTKFNTINNYFTLINVGTGAGVYKDVDNLGRKRFRSLRSLSDILTITQEAVNGNTVDFNIDEDELTTLIQNTVCINSTTLTVTQDENGCFTIEQPTTTVIPALYVNNLYEPTYEDWVAAGGDLTTNPSFVYVGEGSLAKTFTDSVRYTSPTTKVTTANTAIQNALDYYVGTGTRLAPQRAGQKIIVQDNRPNNAYIFTGNFNYTSLDIELQRTVSSTTTGFLVNMNDNTAFNTTTSACKITISKDVVLQIAGDGVNNSGSTTATNNFVASRTLVLDGEGLFYSAETDISKYLINSDPDSDVNGTTGCNNDGNLAITINCQVRADYQGIYKVGGLSRIELTNKATSGLNTYTVDSSLKAFVQNGGVVRAFNIDFSLGGTTGRDEAFTFERVNGFTPSVIFLNTTFTGTSDVWFSKLNNGVVGFTMTNASTLFFAATELFDSTDLWSVTFRNNVFEDGNIDFSKVDFTNTNTISSLNTIGGNIIETLVKYGSRTLAEAALPMGSKFINTNAGDIDPDTWFIDITMQ